MKYALVQDMIDRFGEAELIQLTDRAIPPTGSYVAEIIEENLNDAEAEINAYLANRYALPLAEVPTILKRLTCDVARYHLHGSNLTEEVTQRYKDSVAFLKRISKGDASLGINQDSGTSPTVENVPEYFGAERIFSNDSLRDYSD